MIYDFLAFTGIGLLSVGVWVQLGWPYAAIVAGVILFAIGILGAINDNKETAEPPNEKA